MPQEKPDIRPDIWYRSRPYPTEWNFVYYPRDVRERGIEDLSRRIYRINDQGHYEEIAVFKNEKDAQAAVDAHNWSLKSYDQIKDLESRLARSIDGGFHE